MHTGTTTREHVTADRQAQTIRYWMSAPVIVIAADATVAEALALMHEHSIRRLPVVTADGMLCGIITDGDIRGADVLHTAGFNERLIATMLGCTTVYEVMTERPITVRPSSTLREAAMLMLDNKIGGLPVLDAAGAIAGMVTESDLFEALVCYLDAAEMRG